MKDSSRLTILKECTQNNHWFIKLAKRVLECYPLKVAGSIVGDIAQDVSIFGYEYSRNKWAAFIRFHFGKEI